MKSISSILFFRFILIFLSQIIVFNNISIFGLLYNKSNQQGKISNIDLTISLLKLFNLNQLMTTSNESILEGILAIAQH